MKRTIKTIRKQIISLFFILYIILSLITPVLAWDDCPFGKVNDSYPGDCPRYIDTNNDGICDHSQEAPAFAENNETITNNDNKSQSVLTKNKINNNILIAALAVFLPLLFFIGYSFFKKKKLWEAS